MAVRPLNYPVRPGARPAPSSLPVFRAPGYLASATSLAQGGLSSQERRDQAYQQWLQQMQAEQLRREMEISARQEQERQQDRQRQQRMEDWDFRRQQGQYMSGGAYGFNPYRGYGYQGGYGQQMPPFLGSGMFPGNYQGYGYGMSPEQMQAMTLQRQLNDEYQKRIDQANQANQNRYETLVKGSTDLHSRALNQIAALGGAQLDDVNEAYRKLQQGAYQGLAARGLTGTTVVPGVRQTLEQEQQQALRRVNEDIINRRVNADVSLTNNMLGFVERRSDIPPDLNQLIGLQQGMGAAGNGAYGYLGNQGRNWGYGGGVSPPPSYGYQQRPQMVPQFGRPW